MALTIVVATHNRHKLGEMQALFSGVPVTLVTMADVGIECEVEETGKTFAENALIKAQAIAALTKLPVLADDSGLEIMALDRFPGVYSARFMQGASYVEKNTEILRMLAPYKDRSARFCCTMALMNVSPHPEIFEGITEGTIDTGIRGENGFGYDPIFVSRELQANFGLASAEEKNRVSHRGKAVREVIAFLRYKKLI